MKLKKLISIVVLITIANILLYMLSLGHAPNTVNATQTVIIPSLAYTENTNTNTNQIKIIPSLTYTENKEKATNIQITPNILHEETDKIETNAKITHTMAKAESNLNIYADGAILIDSSTGKILYGKNENEKMYPASTTKILTAILALENCSLTDKITASRTSIMSVPSGYSNASIQEGETLTVQELLDLFLIHSANEVGYIFAEDISGSTENFANLMNQKASEIGCKNTHFTNPSGIHDANHYSTPYDMALIAKYCMQNSTFREIVAKKSCTVEATDKSERRYYKNTNSLLDSSSEYYYPYAIGLKTGFTSQAKNCLIATSQKDGLELITVVLGADAMENGKSSRYPDTINLFNYGYDNYQSKEILDQNNIVETITIKNATKNSQDLQLLAKDSIIATVPVNLDLNTLNFNIILNENIEAPIAEGTVLGKIYYDIDGLTYSSDLIASHDVEKSNLIVITLQVLLAILILFILSKLLSNKKSRKNKYKKKKRDPKNKFNK